VYGHEFLAQRSLVQLSLGHPFSRGPEHQVPPVKLYSRSGQDSLNLWSSLKLVMTSKSDITAVPHSVILPLPDEREVFSFQVADLERFTLELSLYPTFGSKVIGRAIILPPTFLDIQYQKGLVAPLLDHHLKTIGEVSFEVCCIKPFQGAQLEIGGRVETYWKSKVTPSAPTQDHAHQYQAHRPLSVSTSSPALRPPPVPPQVAPRESALVTASSLWGEYVHITVQVTKDHVPVVYPEWRLPIDGLDIGVSDVTCAQFLSIAESRGRKLSSTGDTAAEWYNQVFRAMATLDEVLSTVPAEMGINLQPRYARNFDAASQSVGKSGEVNAFVDAVLHTVYDAGKTTPGRKIIFNSFDPTVCTALNWKQPNCGRTRLASTDCC
jgi:CDK inhibitor PHO81